MYTAAAVIFVLVCLPVIRWVVKAVSPNTSTVIDAPPEFEASPYTEKRHLQIVRDAPREASSNEKALLHEIHSQNCCTLYDQEKDK